MAGSTSGISVQELKLNRLAPGKSITVSVPVISNLNTVDGSVDFALNVEEPLGFGTDPFSINVKTRQFVQPFLSVVDYAITGSSSGKLEKKKAFDLQVLLQNTKYGTAEDVRVVLNLPDNVLLLDGNQVTNYLSLEGGSARTVTYSLIVNNNYTSSTIPIRISLKEKYGKYSEDKLINLELDQTMSSQKIVVNSSSGTKHDDINLAALRSDVDMDIPKTRETNEKTFAVIIANEEYKRVAPVEFAMNDGRIFKEYCMKTLGIPETQIHHLENASLNEIRGEVRWLADVMKAYEGTAKIIFYYAGHGIPDESERTSYLLPVDGYETDVQTGYKLGDLYRELGEMSSRLVTVFIDACFGGSKREGDMIANARGAVIKIREEEPVGNMVVFTASKGDETAFSYKEQKHGMFTYFLLKKLKLSSGEVALGELADYISSNVRQKSIVLNSKPQNPTVIPSLTLDDAWKTQKLK